MTGKKILLSFARSPLTLDMARQLHALGHEVFVADCRPWHITRFSNTVKKSFIVPRPRVNLLGFIQGLVDIIQKEGIELFIPIFEDVMYIARGKHLFPKTCEVFCSDFETLESLHNKWTFLELLKAKGLQIPETYLLESSSDLITLPRDKTFVIKPCYSRQSQNLIKLTPSSTLPSIDVSKEKPWIAQELLEGEHLCSYNIANNGKLRAHSVYPVCYTVEGNSCITFESVSRPMLLEWMEKFISSIHYHGQVSFDFIDVPGRGLFAIDCNPRTTSGIHLFQPSNHLDQAFLGTNEQLIVPTHEARRQIFFAMLLYGWRSFNRSKNLRPFLKQLCTTEDVVFKKNDIKPMLAQVAIFPTYWKMSRECKVPIPSAFIHDVDWNGEPLPQLSL